ncbi:MAG: DUF4157 domain-containing protein [Oculatellaceae cyanobacterium bins.114]|nr:DUF4157 domain-containing protein [Oculatellaceae cyanobacterium bins.114]
MSTKTQVVTNTTEKPSLNGGRSGLLQRKCECGSEAGLTGKCSECQSKPLTLQRKVAHDSELDEVPPIVYDVLRSPGQPLDPETRTFMESRFQHDFSCVRVHTDDKAAESAQAINAKAYTVKQDIVFGTKKYAPETKDGKQLLAHELAHAIQQAQSIPNTYLRIAPASDQSEIEAERIASTAINLSKETRISPKATPYQLARVPEAKASKPNTATLTANPTGLHEVENLLNKILEKVNPSTRRAIIGDPDISSTGYNTLTVHQIDEIDSLGKTVSTTYGYSTNNNWSNPDLRQVASSLGLFQADELIILGGKPHAEVVAVEDVKSSNDVEVSGTRNRFILRAMAVSRPVCIDCVGEILEYAKEENLGIVAYKKGRIAVVIFVPQKTSKVVVGNLEVNKGSTGTKGMKSFNSGVSKLKKVITGVAITASVLSTEGKATAATVGKANSAIVVDISTQGNNSPGAPLIKQQDSNAVAKLQPSGTPKSNDAPNTIKASASKGGVLKGLGIQLGSVALDVGRNLANSYLTNLRDSKIIEDYIRKQIPSIEEQVVSFSLQIEALKSKPSVEEIYAFIDIKLFNTITNDHYLGIIEDPVMPESITVTEVSPTSKESEFIPQMPSGKIPEMFVQRKVFTFSVMIWSLKQEEAEKRKREQQEEAEKRKKEQAVLAEDLRRLRDKADEQANQPVGWHPPMSLPKPTSTPTSVPSLLSNPQPSNTGPSFVPTSTASFPTLLQGTGSKSHIENADDAIKFLKLQGEELQNLGNALIKRIGTNNRPAKGECEAFLVQEQIWRKIVLFIKNWFIDRFYPDQVVQRAVQLLDDPGGKLDELRLKLADLVKYL